MEEINELEDLPFERDSETVKCETVEKKRTQTPITLDELEEIFKGDKEWLHAEDVDTYFDMFIEAAISKEEQVNLIEESYRYYKEFGREMNIAQKLEFINNLTNETEYIIKV